MHTRLFDWVGAFSPAPNTKTGEALLPDAAAAARLKQLWISCGDADRLVNISTRTHNYLQSLQVPHQYLIEPGDLDFKVWKNDLYLFSRLLFK